MRLTIQKCMCLLILIIGCLLPCATAKAVDYGDDTSWTGQAGKDPKMTEDDSMTYVT